MIVFYALRMIVWFGYFFGYMIVHYPTLRRGEKALQVGDTDTVRQIVLANIPKWCNTLMKIGGVTMQVTGLENIPAHTNCVFVANHRGMFDIPVMLTALGAPHGILAKKESEKIPLVNRWMKLLGCVFVDRSDVRASMRALNDAAETVKSGRSFSVFPEGTRYKGEEGGIGEFKGGAFRIATKNKVPVVPVAIAGSRDRFEKYKCIVLPGVIRVQVLPPIDTAALSREQQKTLPETVQQQIHQALQAMLAAEKEMV